MDTSEPSTDVDAATQRYTTVVAAESARALAALRATDPGYIVPSTPEWSVGDLAWHLAEVQWFWGEIVTGLLDDDGVEALVEPDRPDDHDATLRFLAGRSTALIAALEHADPAAPCWSWSHTGGDVAWVARRQAHEALIHRVDAELAAGVEPTVPDAALAADGVAELFDVMMAPPPWATVTPDGHAVRVEATDTGHAWDLVFGRLTGTSPHSGRAHDLDAAVTTAAGPEAAAVVAGTAWNLDRWLWGRGPADPLRVTGDKAVVHRLRAVAEVE